MAQDWDAVTAANVADVEFIPMDQVDAAEVGSWSYPGIYAFYDFQDDADDLAALHNPDHRIGRYFSAVLADRGMLGFVEIKLLLDGSVEIGLGLRPELTGRGLGLAYVTRICEWVAGRADTSTLKLRVAEFNARAIAVYERVGFTRVSLDLVTTNGRSLRFFTMVMKAPVR